MTLAWKRATPDFQYQTYNRDHTWKFDGGHEMDATAAPAYLGNTKFVDPEEAFVASLSSCHMLTFLALAARKGIELGRLGKAEEAAQAIFHLATPLSSYTTGSHIDVSGGLARHI